MCYLYSYCSLEYNLWINNKKRNIACTIYFRRSYGSHLPLLLFSPLSHLKDSTSPATGEAKASATGTSVLKVRCRNSSGRDTTQFRTSILGNYLGCCLSRQMDRFEHQHNLLPSLDFFWLSFGMDWSPSPSWWPNTIWMIAVDLRLFSRGAQDATQYLMNPTTFVIAASALWPMWEYV